MEVKEVLYVLGLQKNLPFVLAMENRGLEVSFTGGQALVRPKGVDPSVRQVIGNKESNLYLLKGQSVKALIHSNDNLSELWHERMGHLHYRAIPVLQEMVTDLPQFGVKQDGDAKVVCFASMPRQNLLTVKASPREHNC